MLQCQSSCSQPARHAVSYHCPQGNQLQMPHSLLSCIYQGTFYTAKPTTKPPSTKIHGTYQLGALRKGVEFIQATLAGVCELCH